MKTKMQLAIRELRRNRRFRRHVLAVAVTIAVLAYLGPFGTAVRLESGELILYWLVAVAGNWSLAMTIVPAAHRVAAIAGKPVWVGTIAGALAAAFPGTAIVFALEWQVGDPITSATGLVYLYSCVALVFLVLSFLAYHLVEMPLRAPASECSPEPASQSSGSSPFLSRLPSRLGFDLLHLRMQDHYVQAHTTNGSELVLLRFRDALREVENLDGLQVHRSHWVARSAIKEARRRSGRVTLELVNGTEVPVSRSYVSILKSEGLL
ncbi:MAG: LytTR family DNA-binding domain-containing protein [Albidovulum sp.]|nr:LytTR family DNA-binding domain-containing protein [Albidovulum sp.]